MLSQPIHVARVKKKIVVQPLYSTNVGYGGKQGVAAGKEGKSRDGFVHRAVARILREDDESQEKFEGSNNKKRVSYCFKKGHSSPHPWPPK